MLNRFGDSREGRGRRVRYLDLSVKDRRLKSQLLKAVERVLAHGRVILGPEVGELEDRIALFCGRKFAVGVSSGTAALYTALRALDIGPGDEVITTPLSWIATVNSIVLAGAAPVFVDIGRDLNLNAELIGEAITPRTKAIMPVHFTGKMCDVSRIRAVAEKHNLSVVEDAAQAFGASFRGWKAGSTGRIACFSMNSMKVFHSYGEAGALVTDDESLKEKIVCLRYAGTIEREDCHYPSLNFRIETLQAAMLLVEMNRIDRILERRRAIARLYDEELAGVVECPREDPNCFHVYYTYTIQVDRRDDLRNFLAGKHIETKIHHPILMPYHTAYRGKFKLNIPVAERLVGRILSIPNHEKMTDRDVEYVASSIRQFYGA